MKHLIALLLALLIPATAIADEIVYLSPQTKRGLSYFKAVSVVNAAQAIKASTGQLYGWHLYNSAAAVRYFKFYNVASASVTVGTTTPDLTIAIPAGAAANVEFTQGIAFSTAISVACTSLAADNDNTAPTAGDCLANVVYK